MFRLLLRINLIVVVVLALSGCEVIARYQCKWYLVPDLEKKHLVDPGWVSVCLRNYDIGKQKCSLKAKYKLAESSFGKPFRYVDVDIYSKTYPREIKSIEICQK